MEDTAAAFGMRQAILDISMSPASYVTEKRQIIYFDPALKTLWEQLHNALPGKPLSNIISASTGEGKLMLIASSDTDPGIIYLHDMASRQPEPVLPLRNYMTGRPMGIMEPVVFPAADSVPVPGYLTMPLGSSGKNLPAIVLPHGGPSGRCNLFLPAGPAVSWRSGS